MRQLRYTKSSTKGISGFRHRRWLRLESLESRRVLASHPIEFEIFALDENNNVTHVCNGSQCSDFDIGEIEPGAVKTQFFAIHNLGTHDVKNFQVRVEGTLVPDVFSSPSGSCYGFSVLPAGHVCGIEFRFSPAATDPPGTVYGGDLSQIEVFVSGESRPGKAQRDELHMGVIGRVASPSEPPTADAGATQSGVEDELLTFDASASSDPDGDPLTYLWDFGDGQTLQTSDPIVQHAYAFGGSFDVTLTVDDGNGNQSTDMTMATVAEVNDIPVADAGGPYSGFENIAMTLDATNTSDFDNLDGTTANDQSLEYTWDFGDGTVVTTTAPTIDHTYTSAATYTVTLTVDDGSASSAPVQTTAVVNTQPSGNPNDIYVWDIGFDQQNRGRHVDHFITVDVNRDSDADGLASSTDVGATGVTVTVELRGDNGFFQTFTGVTDENGLFRSGKIRNLAPGNYTAEVVDLAHQTLQWNHLLDPTLNDEDADGNGLPDDVLTVT